MEISKHNKNESFLYSIFLISDYLLEMSNNSIVVFFIVSFIEFIQINYFFLNPLFINYWNNETLFDGYISFIKYFWIDQIFSTTNRFNKFLVVFYFWIVLIFIIYIVSLFSIIFLKNNLPINVVMRYFLIFIINIFIPVLYTPMLSAFLTIFMCPNKNNYFFPNTQCFKNTQIVHCVFSVIGISLILLYGYINSLIYFETNPKSNNIKARFNTKYENFFFITKTMWICLFHLTSFYENEREWLMAVINIAIAIINFFLLIKDKPFYNTKVNKILLIFRSIELITSIILIIGKLIGSNKFEGEFIMYFIGVILIVGIIVVYPENKFKIVILNTDSIRDVDLFQRKLIYTFELIENQEQMQYELFLKGYIITNVNISEHQDNIDESTCSSSIKRKVDSVSKNPNDKCKKHAEEYLAFQRYIGECYKKGLRKFPQSNSLRLNYLLFSIRYLQNPQISMMIMKQIEIPTLSMEEKFILYRYSKILEERLIEFNPNAIKIDINNEIRYKRNKNIFLKLIEKITYYLTEFWDAISREHANFLLIETLIYKINIKLESLSTTWNELLKLKTNDSKLIYIYENFLKSVMNDEQGAEDLLTKYIDIQQNCITTSISGDENYLGEYETYIQDGSGYIISSGNGETFGKIISFNPSLARLFNYTTKELKTKNIDILLPELFRNDHNRILQSFSSNDDIKEKTSKNFGKVSSVGLKKTGYIFPINLTTTILSGINNTVNFLGLVKPPPSDNFKPYPIYFLTDSMLNIRNVSSQAIQIFGINSNNICYKDKNGKTEYINIGLLIKDLENFKNDRTLVDQYKSGIGIVQKKKIVLDDLSHLNEVLDSITEKNKAVKLVDMILNHDKSQIHSHLNKTFKEFYISLSNVKFSEKTVGYQIKLEPIYEENYLIDTKNTIVYENDILAFNPHTFQFVVQDGKNTDFSSGKFISDNTMKNSLYHLMKKNKNDDNVFQTNLVNYLYKKFNIKDYGDIQKIKTIVRVQGRPDKEIFPTKSMKIDDDIKNIDNAIRNVKGKELMTVFDEEGEDEKNEEQNLLQKTTETLLNFKGIEGWTQIYSKLRKTKIPNDILLLRVLLIVITVIKLCLIIVVFLYQNSKMIKLHEINEIKNLTYFHTHYILDSITQTEKFMYHYNKNNTAPSVTTQRNLIVSNVQNIINITNILRQISNIDRDEYHFYDNRSFVLLNNPGVGQHVDMNLIEVFIQLINKLLGMTRADEAKGIQQNYNLFMINAINVYIQSIFEIVSNLETIIVKEINNLNDKLKLFLILSIILIVVCLLNIYHYIKISFMKNTILNLFFTIPEKICWKYYSNCEWFMKYIKNYDIFDIENTTKNAAINAPDNKEKKINRFSISSGQREEENSYFIKTKRALSSINLDNKKISLLSIIQVILINLVFFIIDFSFYLFSFVNFNINISQLKETNTFAYGSFLVKVYMSLYVINQRQIYSNTGYTILNQTNSVFQEAAYIQTSKRLDDYLAGWYSDGITLFDKINASFSYNDRDFDINQIITTGQCQKEEYTNVCNKIQEEYRGIIILSQSLFYNFTQIYIDYINDKYPSTNPPGFAYESYSDLNDILFEYFCPTVNELYLYLFSYLNSSIDHIKAIFIVLVSLYLFVDIFIFLVYWLVYQSRAIKYIVFAKTTLLLIHPKDVREIRYVMNYLQKEIYKINSSN